MAIDEEAILIKAYNSGYTLSTYEPSLLEQIIRQNQNNEFVKVMKSAREQQEFETALPKKDFSQEYKNGFRSAPSLTEQEPKTFDQLVNSKEVPNDFKQGLVAGKKEHKIRQTMERIKEEREQQRGLEQDRGLGL
jgi:hypothetical protein